MGDFKRDINKSIGDLARLMERGFAGINTRFAELDTKFTGKFAELDTKIESVKSDLRFTKWQVHLIFGGATAVSTI